MADGPLMHGMASVLDYQGKRDERTWVTRESVWESECERLHAEIAFLREMLRLALAQNTGREPNGD